MKKLLFVASALAAISLLAPSSGVAQWENRIGVYTDPDPAMGSAELTVAANVPTFIYFVLMSPRNAGTPVTNIEAFEFTADAVPFATFFKLQETFNPAASAINISAYPEYVVGYAAPVPVVDDMVVLMTWQVMVISGDPHKLFLNTTTEPTLDGAIAFQDANGAQLVQMDPSVTGGNLGDNVFAINGVLDPTAEETQSWGGVKALFR